MGKRDKEWAKEARRALVAELGGSCAWCETTEELTFDCIIPTGDAHHRGSTDQRMRFYIREHREQKNIQLLCHKCNSAKGDSITNDYVPEMNWEHCGAFQPF